MINEPKYELVIQFEDHSASFVHGFEAGRVWQQMKDRIPVIKETVSHTNTDLFGQMATRCDYKLSLTDLGNNWMELRAEDNNMEPANSGAR